MADNTLQSGTDTIATDDVATLNGGASSGVKVQRTKVTYGDDGTARDVSVAFPLPTMVPDATAAGTISATDAVVAAPSGTGALLTGTPTALSFVAMALTGGDSSWLVQLTGTFGGGTVWFEASANSTNGIDGSWSTLTLRQLGTSGSVATDSVTVAGLYRGNAGGMAYLRVRVVGATTPSIAVVHRASDGAGPTALNAPIPAGANMIGSVKKAPSSTGTITSVTAAAASTQLLAANTNRLGATFYNESTATLYLALSTAASVTAYTLQIAAGGYFELPNDSLGYVGAIFGIWSAANGAARITELT